MHVAEQVIQLGHRIRIARIRRGWSVADLASKAGINRNTLTALELGKPGTAVGVCFTVLWALGLDRTLDGVADDWPIDYFVIGHGEETAPRLAPEPDVLGNAAVGDEVDFLVDRDVFRRRRLSLCLRAIRPIFMVDQHNIARCLRSTSRGHAVVPLRGRKT